MTRLFLDTNIVIDVLGRREPFYKEAVQLFTMAYNKQVQLIVSPMTYATAAFILRKHGPEGVKKLLSNFRQISRVAITNEHIIDIIDRSKIENNKLVFIDWSKMEDINEFTQFIKLFNLDTNDRYVKTITSEFGKSQYKKFFDVLLEAKGSVLFHCVYGKDRTGIAAVLLLGILDVNDKEIRKT